MYSFLLEITTNERADIVDSLKQTHPKARTLIEEIENLEPHHGLVIEGPADIADQLRIVSSQGEPALPVFYVSGDGAQRPMQLGSSFDPKRVVHIASMVMRDAAVTSLARALRQSADDLLAHIDDADSDDLAIIAEAAAKACRAAIAGLQGQPQKHAKSDQVAPADTRLLAALDFA